MRRTFFEKKINQLWYQPKLNLTTFLLLPFSYLYHLFIKIKSWWPHPCYRSRIPVIVVGNLTVGGSGKTPLLITLIELLQRQGISVGVVSRGYPLKHSHPVVLTELHTAAEVGDEPWLIFHRTGVSVCVCQDRVAAIQSLEALGVSLILSDDGLQNQTFFHTMDIVVVDQDRQFGNGQLLPAGPLREPLSRLQQVDFVLEKCWVGGRSSPVTVPHKTRDRLVLSAQKFFPVTDLLLPSPDLSKNLSLPAHTAPSLRAKRSNDGGADSDYFIGKPVIAMTAIAHPDSFFNALKAAGVSFTPRQFHDHYGFKVEDFIGTEGKEIIMTEKDAVKCLEFANGHFWCWPLQGELSLDFETKFLAACAKML